MFVSCERELFCLASTETRMFIRDGDKGGWGGGGGEDERKSEGSVVAADPEDQDAVDCHQNNKAVSASQLSRSYCPNCLYETESQRQSGLA